MKYTLKKNKTLTTQNNHEGLDKADWEALNAGKSVTLETVPEAAQDKLKPVKKKSTKKKKKE